MSIEARNRPLPDWFTRIRTHQTVLPRFQRFEAWAHANVAQLFNMILRDLPVGSALVLEVGDNEPFISRHLKGAPEIGERVTEHLLDGQQRLTALWRGLNNNYEQRTYFLFLSIDDETQMPYYVDSIGRWVKDGDKEPRPFWANRPTEHWKRHMVPLDLCAPDIESQQRLRSWLQEAIKDQNERDTVYDQVSVVRQKLSSFNLPFLSLPVTTKKEVALDVFMKMNTTAAPLSTYDIVVAQVEGGTGKSLHDLVAEFKDLCSAMSAYYPLEELSLYASALLQGRDPTNSTYLNKDFGSHLLSNWTRVVEGATRCVAFLEEERIFDAARLPTDVVVPVLTALWALAPKGLDAEGRTRTILRKYLWRAFFTSRYEKSTNSRALADFNELKGLLLGASTGIPVVFDDSAYPLPESQELLAAGWPVRKDRLARAILSLALRNGGLDLADGSTATRSSMARREYHHIFPDAYLTRLGEREENIFCALNCALITWNTNRNISDKNPERYIAERSIGSVIGDAEVRSRLLSHLIPFDEMVAGDYARFLSSRADLVHSAMTRLCSDGQLYDPGAKEP